jgi:hypothetical protein
MSNRPVSIEFIADVSKYLRETKKMEVSTEDIADAFVAVSNDSADLERKLSAAMRGAEKDVDRLARTIKDLPDATGKAAKEADKDFRKVGDSASDAGKETGQNFASNLGEGLSSGDLSDTLQDALGEMLGQIKGPLTAAIGVGAALALAVWNSFQQESKKQKEMLNSVLDITDEMTGAIDKIGLMRLGLEELGGGDYGQGLRDAAKYARLIGVSAEDLVAVVSGDLNPASQATLGLLQQEAAQYDELVKKRKLTPDERERREAVREILATTKLTVDAVRQGKDAQETWASATGETRTETENQARAQDAAARAAERQAAAAAQTRDSVTTALEKLQAINAIGDKTIRVNIDTRIQGSAPAAAFIGKYAT